VEITKLEIRPYQNDDCGAIACFFDRCFLNNLKFTARSHDSEYYLWKYKENPWGKPAVFLAVTDGKIIGLFSVVPKTIRIKNETLRIGETGDAYIDPNYQGTGVLWKLISHAFKSMKKQNISSFYTIANEPTLKIWTELFKFKKLFEYRSMVLPLDFSDIFKKRLNLGPLSSFLALPCNLFYRTFYRQPNVSISQNIQFQKVDGADKRLDEFWEERGSNGQFTFVKNSEFFKYRYSSNPEKYGIYILQNDKEVLGYSVLKFTDLFNMKCGHIVDFMVSKNDALLLRKIIGLSLDLIKKEGAQIASSWAIEETAYYKIFKRFGFITRKKRYHVIFGGDIIKRDDAHLMLNSNSWLFTHGDSDNI